jgi:hypothetical protein
MTSPPPDIHYQTLMHRAWENYEFIKKHASVGGPYEVTQLLATFMIAVAHPRERALEHRMNDLQIEYAVSYFGLPELGQVQFEPRPFPRRPPSVSEEREFEPNVYVGDQIEIIRNAIAHGNIDFSSSDAAEDISEIRLVNVHRGRQRDCILTTFDLLEEYTRICISIADYFFSDREQLRRILTSMYGDAQSPPRERRA